MRYSKLVEINVTPSTLDEAIRSAELLTQAQKELAANWTALWVASAIRGLQSRAKIAYRSTCPSSQNPRSHTAGEH